MVDRSISVFFYQGRDFFTQLYAILCNLHPDIVMNVSICLYVYKSIYLCVYYTSVCIYICVSICLCVCVYVSVSVYVCVCLYLCLCLGLCMCVYVYVYSESRQHFSTLQPVPFWKIYKASQWLQYMICACKWGIIFLKIISKIYVGSVIQNVFIIIFIRL